MSKKYLGLLVISLGVLIALAMLYVSPFNSDNNQTVQNQVNNTENDDSSQPDYFKGDEMTLTDESGDEFTMSLETYDKGNIPSDILKLPEDIQDYSGSTQNVDGESYYDGTIETEDGPIHFRVKYKDYMFQTLSDVITVFNNAGKSGDTSEEGEQEQDNESGNDIYESGTVDLTERPMLEGKWDEVTYSDKINLRSVSFSSELPRFGKELIVQFEIDAGHISEGKESQKENIKESQLNTLLDLMTTYNPDAIYNGQMGIYDTENKIHFDSLLDDDVTHEYPIERVTEVENQDIYLPEGYEYQGTDNKKEWDHYTVKDHELFGDMDAYTWTSDGYPLEGDKALESVWSMKGTESRTSSFTGLSIVGFYELGHDKDFSREDYLIYFGDVAKHWDFGGDIFEELDKETAEDMGYEFNSGMEDSPFPSSYHLPGFFVSKETSDGEYFNVYILINDVIEKNQLDEYSNDFNKDKVMGIMELLRQ
ncbi:hypothetical protein ABID56_002545 [Alkalibacillus flavidus]|uniref:Uncharacterized protein n=1 Tax=Alkalibacillus flavidus TaxID=546021 RepID=A0ABV2KXU3_9BACI